MRNTSTAMKDEPHRAHDAWHTFWHNMQKAKGLVQSLLNCQSLDPTLDQVLEAILVLEDSWYCHLRWDCALQSFAARV